MALIALHALMIGNFTFYVTFVGGKFLGHGTKATKMCFFDETTVTIIMSSSFSQTHVFYLTSPATYHL